MFFYKQRLSSEHRGLWQLEIFETWIQEEGNKNMMLYGYPAAAESEMKGLAFGGTIIFHYLKFWRIWIGSGIQAGLGVIDERFSIGLHRGGREIALFDPPSGLRIAGEWNSILLSASMLEGLWSSWDIQLGYHHMNANRPNGYGGFREGMYLPGTHIKGWYVQIRKLFPLDFNWKRIVEVKPKKE